MFRTVANPSERLGLQRWIGYRVQNGALTEIRSVISPVGDAPEGGVPACPPGVPFCGTPLSGSRTSQSTHPHKLEESRSLPWRLTSLLPERGRATALPAAKSTARRVIERANWTIFSLSTNASTLKKCVSKVIERCVKKRGSAAKGCCKQKYSMSLN